MQQCIRLPIVGVYFLFRGRTHVRIKGQNLNFYLETHATPHNIHATPHNIYLIWLRILPRILGTLYWRVDDPLAVKIDAWQPTQRPTQKQRRTMISVIPEHVRVELVIWWHPADGEG